MMQILSRNKTFVFALVCWLNLHALAACGQVTAGEPDGGLPDAATLDAAVMPDASPPPVRLITHSTSHLVQAGNGVACTDNSTEVPFKHRANSYFRVFHLPDLDVTGAFEISTVRIGIDNAVSPSGMQPAEVRLHTLTDGAELLLENLTLLESTELMVENQTTALLDIPIEATVPAGATLVVEFHTPNGVPNGNTLYVGANNLGESAPSYIVASDCTIPDPTPWPNIGFPERHMVLSLLGRERP